MVIFTVSGYISYIVTVNPAVSQANYQAIMVQFQLLVCDYGICIHTLVQNLFL